MNIGTRSGAAVGIAGTLTGDIRAGAFLSGSRLPPESLPTAATVTQEADVVRAVDRSPRSPVLRMRTLGEAKGRRLHVGERFFPLRRFAGIDEGVVMPGSITQALVARGVPDYLRRESRMTAILRPAKVAELLLMPGCRPALCVRSVDADTVGMQTECVTGYASGDRVGLTVPADD